MKPNPKSQSRLPANRAFVVQFQVAEPGTSEGPHGRVEHIVSGQATHFDSWRELEAFMTGVLMKVQDKPS